MYASESVVYSTSLEVEEDKEWRYRHCKSARTLAMSYITLRDHDTINVGVYKTPSSQALLTVLAVSAYAAPQGYSLPSPSGPGFTTKPRPHLGSGLIASSGISAAGTVSGTAIGLGHISGQGTPAGLGLTSGEGISSGTNRVTEQSISPGSGVSFVTSEIDTGSGTDRADVVCKEGEILHVDGTCVVPEVSRKVFVFDVPQQEQLTGPPPSVPPPKVDHNILFVRLPEEGLGPEPIVVPPPRQNNIVYVLNKQGEQSQRVIEVPAPPPSEPEIYFVNYEEGENPTLPGGVDLHTALGSAAETGGEVIGTFGADGGLQGSTGDQAGVGSFGVLQGNVGVGIGVGIGGGSTGVSGNVGSGRGQGGSAAVGTVGGTVGANAGVIQGNLNVPSGLYGTP
ncbi:pupal cuticle protein 36-like [Penaeus indicus]|uniref:pupal cuticle protein 36-like n=1 Tax=Penaeus indicus TaxID=29960 RepID=UPI00300D6216